MDLDLGTLKREILEYLDASGFAVFRSQPGAAGSIYTKLSEYPFQAR